MINKDCTLGFLFGLSMGVAGALLMAPMSGVQTRQRIKDTANEGTGYLREQGAALRAQATDLVDTTRKTAQEAKGQVAEAVNAARKAYRDARAAGTPVDA